MQDLIQNRLIEKEMLMKKYTPGDFMQRLEACCAPKEPDEDLMDPFLRLGVTDLCHALCRYFDQQAQIVPNKTEMHRRKAGVEETCRLFRQHIPDLDQMALYKLLRTIEVYLRGAGLVRSGNLSSIQLGKEMGIALFCNILLSLVEDPEKTLSQIKKKLS